MTTKRDIRIDCAVDFGNSIWEELPPGTKKPLLVTVLIFTAMSLAATDKSLDFEACFEAARREFDREDAETGRD